MLVNEMLCLPTPDTLTQLSFVFSACPFDIDLHKAYVTMNISTHEMKTDDNALYKAQAGNLGVFYDTATQRSSLLLPIVSPALNDRVAQIRQKAPNVFYGEHYFPHLMLVEDFPPISRRYSGFLASVGNSLATLMAPLFFDAELVMSKEYHAVPQADYYASMLANHERN